ncbi:MAG: response regulator [Vicinamibacterales bacterium]
MPPARVLVAEDNPESQLVATRILEGAGARVECAPDGEVAVVMAARTRYDLILMDLQMPVLDGLQAAMAIRHAERLRDDEPVPILAFTAHAAEGLRQQCLAAGMNDYIVKPAPGHDLVNALHRWVDRRPAVLVADDAPEIRRLVTLRLRGTYRIVQAVNGRDALEQFGRQPISLVLLDMNMPVLDGYATAAAIRLREDGQDVPIVALTGSDGQAVRDRAVAAGCTMHLAKPVRLATLVSTVEAAMRQGAQPVVDLETPLPSSAPGLLDIDPLLADLVPGYVREKRRQMADLRRLVAEGDMERLKRIAHDIKGTGAAYGIADVTRLGRALETAGQQGDASLASSLVEELDTLLARVQRRLGARD